MGANIESLQRDIEKILYERLRSADEAAGYHVSATAMTSRLFILVSPLETLNITVISPLFAGRDFEERNSMFWSWFGDQVSEDDLKKVDFWRLLDPNEAKDIYPSLLADPALAA